MPKNIILILIIFTIFQTLNADSRNSYIAAGSCTKAPVIDGKLDDEVWKSAAGASFPESPDFPYTHFRVSSDENNIYFAVECTGSLAPEKLRIAEKVWESESIEIFITSKHRSGRYFQLMADISGRILMSYWANGNRSSIKKNDWEFASQISEGKWTAEFSIPLKNIIDPSLKGKKSLKELKGWGLNVCRNYVKENGKIERSSWSALINAGSSFHCPKLFGYVSLGNTNVIDVSSIGDFFPGIQKVSIAYSTEDIASLKLEVSKGRESSPEISETVFSEPGKYTQKLTDRFLSVTIKDKNDKMLYSSGYVSIEGLDEVINLNTMLKNCEAGAAFREKFKSIHTLLESSDRPLSERREIWEKEYTELIEIGNKAILAGFLKSAPARKSNGRKYYGVAIASSMTKILPEKLDSFRGEFRKDISLSAAKGEMEAAQIALYAHTKTIVCREIKVSDLKREDGKEVISAACVSANPVGFVKTLPQDKYKVEYAGWWPDPILDYLSSFGVRKGVLQTIWVSVKVPYDAKAGIYKGTVKLDMANVIPDLEVPLTIKVHDFALPKDPSFPTSIDLCLNYNVYPFRKYTPEEFKKLEENWERFLFEHRTYPGSLYKTGKPFTRGPLADEEVLERWKKLGVRYFNIIRSTAQHKGKKGKHYLPSSELGTLKKKIDGVLAAADKTGMRDRAYIYGWDEWNPDQFKEMAKNTAWLKKNYPDIPLMTTARDRSYGLRLKNIDWFCPEIFDYNYERAIEARKRGKKVWWYICVATKKPYPNIFTDYPAIDGRMLLGFMSFAYKPDGFLYYKMSNHRNNRKLLVGGPFTDWDPKSWHWAHGDGHLIYPGVSGPITSIRMENWLDGMEDYEYLVLAREKIEQLRKDGKTELADKLAKKFDLYSAPGGFVKDLTHYPTSPMDVEKARSDLVEIITAK